MKSSAIKRALSQPSFLIAAGVLLVTAIGFNAVVDALQLHFRKEAVPLRYKLDDGAHGVPTKLGPWVQVSHDEPLDPTTLHTLGTDQFVFRDYVDSRIIPSDVIEAFNGQTNETRSTKLARIQREHPEAVVRFAVVYYTGMVDTVAHIPDHCMVADGYQPTADPRTIDRTLGKYADGSPRKVRMRSINFEDQSGSDRVPRDVAYFFHVNGEYVDSPLAVRGKLQNLFQRHGYYAKVEVTTVLPKQDEAENVMSDLLVYAMPAIERCLPDWKQVEATPGAASERPATQPADESGPKPP